MPCWRPALSFARAGVLGGPFLPFFARFSPCLCLGEPEVRVGIHAAPTMPPFSRTENLTPTNYSPVVLGRINYTVTPDLRDPHLSGNEFPTTPCPQFNCWVGGDEDHPFLARDLQRKRSIRPNSVTQFSRGVPLVGTTPLAFCVCLPAGPDDHDGRGLDLHDSAIPAPSSP